MSTIDIVLLVYLFGLAVFGVAAGAIFKYGSAAFAFGWAWPVSVPAFVLYATATTFKRLARGTDYDT